MSTISRDVKHHSHKNYDLIIIGGGIYGIMLLLEATRRNYRSLLVEEKDFGGQTSLNHLRTVHGGLRYLQTLDLKRFMESTKERKWFFQNFPVQLKPMPCLMPLYKRGLKRRSILRIALLINDLLAINRNRGILPQKKLSRSRTINAEAVKKIFPRVNKD
ncbi:MAG: FAD-dependent oxidoreductase, partial [Candidatus Aminicenantes bacterium]|nr:FAD-dependent oxidoreductase [Candidatus Aminicenantes bacterium]